MLAVRGVDLAVAEGEYLSIVGPSGSGKSTLLHVLGLLDRPTSGTYLLDGVDVARMSEGERAGMRGGRIGFVFQAFHLLPARSVLDNVMLVDGLPAGAAARSAGTGPRRRWTGSGWRTGSISPRRSCPAVSGSGSRSPGRWSAGRRCCWPTSRPATSTRPTPPG